MGTVDFQTDKIQKIKMIVRKKATKLPLRPVVLHSSVYFILLCFIRGKIYTVPKPQPEHEVRIHSACGPWPLCC